MLVEESVIIDAPLQKVWDTFTDLTCWADWNTVLKDVSPPSSHMEKGSSFTCSIRPFLFPIHIKPKIEEVIPLEKVVWTGKKYGVTSRHEFQFSKTPEGVRVTSTEELDGSPGGKLGIMFTHGKVTEMTKKLLKDLKEEAEF